MKDRKSAIPWIALIVVMSVGPLAAQTTPAQPTTETIPAKSTDKPAVSEAPAKVDVQPLATDTEIANRLLRILIATEWFTNPDVSVDEGVAFIKGSTDQDDRKDWAGKLASKTQDVVAVVNQIEVRQRPVWDLSPAWQSLQQMGRSFIQAIPLIGVALVLLMLTWWAVVLATRVAEYIFYKRLGNAMLVTVVSRAAGIVVFLMGLYLVLGVSGLTQMALTVLGGTGLFGLVLGIAFRDIAENFLASVLISVQRPFEAGDFVDVAGYSGVVQRVTTRGTVLITLEGNHVQIPNAIIYKSVIRNMTANPNSRLDFVVGVGYDDSATKAQDLVMKVLQDHPAVLKEPESLVLIDELGPSRVNLRVYFWFNSHEHNGLKVRSAIIRLVKKSLQDAKVSMPDERREMLFPQGITVRMAETPSPPGPMNHATTERTQTPKPPRESAQASTPSEGKLKSEHDEIERQAAQSRKVEPGADLLGGTQSKPAEPVGQAN